MLTRETTLSACPACGTRGEHYCPADVARGPEDSHVCAGCFEIVASDVEFCSDCGDITDFERAELKADREYDNLREEGLN